MILFDSSLLFIYWDVSRFHSHESVEEVSGVDFVLQLLQLFVLFDAVVVHQDHTFFPHIEITETSPKESFIAITRSVEVIVDNLLHFLLSLQRLFFSFRIFFCVRFIEDIKNKEVYFISKRNRCYSKSVVNLYLTILVVSSSSKEHLNDQIK